MESTYKLKLQSQMFIVRELWTSAVVLFIGYLVMVYFYPWGKSIFTEFFVGGYLTFQIIPCVIVHYQYLKYNKDTVLTVNASERTMTIKEKGVEHSFSFDQIKGIRLALMADLYNGHEGGLVAFIRYHYAYIETQGNEKFIITCLLFSDLRLLFKDIGLSFRKDRVLFPTIRMGRYKKDPTPPVEERSVRGAA